MAQHIISLDVSATAVRCAVIEASFRRASLLDVRTVQIPEGANPTELWARVRQELPGSLDSVVVAIDAKNVSTRLLSFPFGDLRKAESAVDFELEGQIPYALEDVATCYKVLERTNERTDILAAIVPKQILVAHLAALSAAGVEPRAVVMPAAALAEYLPADNPDCTAVLDLGASETHLAVARSGLRFARTLRAGGDDLDRVLAKQYNISLAEAREAREREGRLLNAGESGTAEETRLSTALGEGLAPLVTHLLTTFKSLPPHENPKRMLLTGGLSRLPGLPAYLTARLGITVELLDLRAATEFLPGGPAAIGPEYALSLGMALAMFRQGRDVALNFRRGALAYAGDIALFRGQFTRMAVGLSAVFALAIFASVVRYSMLRMEERDLDKGFCTATQRIVGREICDPTAALATLRQTPGAEGASIPSYSAAALLEMMSKAVGTEVDVQFDELDLRVEASGGQAERLSGKGEAASFESTEQLVTALKRDVCVQDAEVSKLRKGQGSGRVEFNLAIKVLCPAGVRPGARLLAAENAAGATPVTPPGTNTAGPNSNPSAAPPPSPPPIPPHEGAPEP